MVQTRLFGVDYDVYTYSNLCSGNDDARRRYQYVVIANSNSEIVEDPCTHPGTFKRENNFFAFQLSNSNVLELLTTLRLLGQLERQITKEKLLEDACTNTEKIKTELSFDTYKFRAKPDIKKCEEYTRQVVTKDSIGKLFGEEIAFEVCIEL